MNLINAGENFVTPSQPPVPMIVGRGALGTLHQGPMPPWGNDPDLARDYKDDPRHFLLDRWELLKDGIEVFHNWVIVLTYYMPDYLDVQGGGKIILPEKVHDEALWQGKVGLVVAKGPLAFKDDNIVQFHGQNVEIGEWVMYDIMEGRQFTIDRMHARRLKDTQIVMRVPDPRVIY